MYHWPCRESAPNQPCGVPPKMKTCSSGFEWRVIPLFAKGWPGTFVIRKKVPPLLLKPSSTVDTGIVVLRETLRGECFYNNGFLTVAEVTRQDETSQTSILTCLPILASAVVWWSSVTLFAIITSPSWPLFLPPTLLVSTLTFKKNRLDPHA